MWPPAMRCTPSRPAWPGGCSTSTIELTGNSIPLTQDALSQLLGVRRTTVTLVVRKLRASGAVRSARRGLVEIDRPRLEEAACECYEVMRCKFDQIFPLDTTRPRIQAAPARETSGDRDSLLAE